MGRWIAWNVLARTSIGLDGDADHPYTVLTEHATRVFQVTPSLSALIQACTRRGFVVTAMEEWLPDRELASHDRRAYGFARQFPLWQMLELRPARP